MKLTNKLVKEFWGKILDAKIELRGGFWGEGGDFCEMQSNPYSPQERSAKTLCYLVEARELNQEEASQYKEEYEKGVAKWVPSNSEYWESVPPIDLNNLFKDAVPKIEGLQQIILQPDDEGWYLGMTVNDKLYENIGYNAATALFWAIYEVIKNET